MDNKMRFAVLRRWKDNQKDFEVVELNKIK